MKGLLHDGWQITCLKLEKYVSSSLLCGNDLCSMRSTAFLSLSDDNLDMPWLFYRFYSLKLKLSISCHVVPNPHYFFLLLILWKSGLDHKNVYCRDKKNNNFKIPSFAFHRRNLVKPVCNDVWKWGMHFNFRVKYNLSFVGWVSPKCVNAGAIMQVFVWLIQ